MNPPFPTFFIIGASKSGTTSLNRYMAGHPEIAMAEPQEPHQLLGPEYQGRLDNYRALFAGHQAIRGECSSGYSNYPYNAEIVDRIADTVPNASFVYLVRDPVDRAVAHYAQHVIKGDEHRPVDEALLPTPDNYYVAASRYATQLERYLSRFEFERILVLEQTELRNQRKETLRRAFEHVGADPGFWDPAFEYEHNVRTGKNPQNVRLSGFGRFLRDSSLNAASRRLLPRRTREAVVRRARSGLGAPVLPAPSVETRKRLTEALAPETHRIRELLGRKFEAWSV